MNTGTRVFYTALILVLQACQYAPSLRRRRQHLPTARPAHRELRLPSRSSHLDSSLCFQPIYNIYMCVYVLKTGKRRRRRRRRIRRKDGGEDGGEERTQCCEGVVAGYHKKRGGKYYWWQYCVRDSSNRSTSLYTTLFVPATENGDERTACWCCDLNQQHDNDRAGM